VNLPHFAHFLSVVVVVVDEEEEDDDDPPSLSRDITLGNDVSQSGVAHQIRSVFDRCCAKLLNRSKRANSSAFNIDFTVSSFIYK
jgi:hypothetical protein